MYLCSNLISTQRIAAVLVFFVCAVCKGQVRTFEHEDKSSHTERSLATLLFTSSLPTVRHTDRLATTGRPAPRMQLFKNLRETKKKFWSTQQMLRESWKKADAYRPGDPNWFNQGTGQKDLAALHREIEPRISALKKTRDGIPGTRNATSLLGALLKNLGTGDASLMLCSDEAPVLKELREWLVKTLNIFDAIRAIPEEQGRVLSTLALGLDARKMLDLGTFTGYSSIAMALPTASDARVICAEKDKQWADWAVNWWEKAKCSDKMEMHVMDALELMQNMIENGEAGTVDFIFCDIDEREKYSEVHEKAMQLLRVGGMVIYYDTLWASDGILDHSYFPAMRDFNKKLAGDPRVVCSLVPLSYGITVCSKTIDLDGDALTNARLALEAKDDKSDLRKLLEDRRKVVVAEREKIASAI